MARTRAAKDDSTPPTGPEMTAEERAELDARLASMMTKPNKNEMPGGRFYLLWSQRNLEGGAGIMVWTPETPEELRGANFFHDAAHGLGAFAKKIAKGKPVRRTATETALINAVLQNRDDPAGYLVYADYLTENGNTQGDFIRLCVELERLESGDAGYDEKNSRMNALIDAHAEGWYAALGELGPRPEVFGTYAPWMWLSLTRGVIEQVVIDRPGLLPNHADRLFAAVPFLRKLEFEKGQFDAAGLAKVKQLAQIEELEFSHADLTADDLAKLLRSKHLTGLKTLILNGNDEIGHAGVHTLTEWPGLARLETLDLTGCRVGPEAVAEFARCERSANLTRLRLGSNAVDDDAAHAIIRSPHLRRLLELGLGGATLDEMAEAGFQTCSFAKTLTRLNLDGATFQPDAFLRFTQCPFLTLESLNLNSVRLRPVEGLHLAVAAFRHTLQELFLDVCELGARGVENLFRGTFPKLARLDLSRNRLATRGALALAGAADSFPVLTSLNLWDNRLGPDAITALANSKLAVNLTELTLNDNKIGPAGALALARSKFLTKLTSLVVDEKAVGKKGKQALLDRFGDSVVSWR